MGKKIYTLVCYHKSDGIFDFRGKLIWPITKCVAFKNYDKPIEPKDYIDFEDLMNREFTVPMEVHEFRSMYNFSFELILVNKKIIYNKINDVFWVVVP